MRAVAAYLDETIRPNDVLDTVYRLVLSLRATLLQLHRLVEIWKISEHIEKTTDYDSETAEGDVKVEHKNPELATIDCSQGIRPITPIHAIRNRTK